MVLSYHINAGYCTNYVRGQNFPFNDCVGRRILMWNEINFMNSAIDVIKMLTAGDPLSVSVKYQNNGMITRTPLIMLSNNTVFTKNAIWNDRMYFETWKSAPLLKSYRKYPHPLTYYHLVKKHVSSL